MPKLKSLVAAALIATAPTAAFAQDLAKSIVLVHGAVMDGAGWRGVYDILRRKGFHVSVAQLPLTGLDADVAATRRLIDLQPGPVVLVGHSYGGAVISAAGTDPKVVSLVYVAALQPDIGESVADLNARWPMPGHPVPLDGGAMIIDSAHFRADIAADVPKGEADFLAASQRPTAFTSFTAKLSAAAWKTKPSFGVVATEDKTIDPNEERFMYGRSGAKVVEVRASHLVHISQPKAVADVIVQAAAAR